MERGAGEGEPVRLRREALLFWRLSEMPPMAIGGWAVGRSGAGEEMPAREVVEMEPALAVRLRALALEEVRWWRTGW
jgi:hypothetical protein